MKKQFKKIISIIFVILFITLTPLSTYIGFKNNINAEPLLLTGLSMKFVATVLASMGALAFVNETIGIEEFYNGFIEFVETQKQIHGYAQTLADLAIKAIIENTKVKVSQLYNLLKEYIQTYAESFLPEAPVIPNLPNVKTITDGLYYGKIRGSVFPSTITKLDYIEKGYYLKTELQRVDSGPAVNTFQVNVMVMYYNDLVTSHKFTKYMPNNLYQDFDQTLKLVFKTQITDNLLRFDYIFNNISTNTIIQNYFELEVEPLVDLLDVPPIPEILVPELPIVKSVPINLTFPWDLDIDTKDVIGLTVDQLLEQLSSISLIPYIQELLDLPKTAVDSMNPPIIDVDEDTKLITGVRDTTIDDVLEDSKEQTTIIGNIRDIVADISNTLEEFLNPDGDNNNEDKDKTDWGNFKGLFDLFYIFYYLILIVIIILIKLMNVVLNLANITPSFGALGNYPTILYGVDYIKNLKVANLNFTIQQIFEYAFTVFFFIFIVKTIQKIYRLVADYDFKIGDVNIPHNTPSGFNIPLYPSNQVGYNEPSKIGFEPQQIEYNPYENIKIHDYTKNGGRK